MYISYCKYIVEPYKEIIWGVGSSIEESLEDAKKNIVECDSFFDDVFNLLWKDVRKLNFGVGVEEKDNQLFGELMDKIVSYLREKEIGKLKTIRCTDQLAVKIIEKGSHELKWVVKKETVADLDLLGTFC